MLYNPSNGKAIGLVGHIIFWSSLAVMFLTFIFLFSADTKIPQKEVTLLVDIRNKINICLPEESEELEESLFNF